MADLGEAKKSKYNKFIYHYMAYDNASKAAIHAGYSEKSARSQANKLLKHPYVKEKIEQLRKEEEIKLKAEYAITKDNVMKKLAKIAYGKISEVANWDHHSMSFIPKEQCENEYLIKSIKVTSSQSSQGSSDSQQIVMEDRVKALSKLADMLREGGSDDEERAAKARNQNNVNDRILGLLAKHRGVGGK